MDTVMNVFGPLGYIWND